MLSIIATRLLPGIALCSAVAAPLISARVAAADLSDVRLRIEHVNDFAAGFLQGSNTYDKDYVASHMAEAVSRPVKANVCKSLPTVKIRMTATEDGQRCPSKTFRIAPGAMAFIWTLQGVNPLTRRPIVLKTLRKDLPVLSSLPQSGCRPLADAALRIAVTACEAQFDVPMPSGRAANQPSASYSIKFEAVNSKGTTLVSKSKSVSIPSKVPLIVSVGESFASGEGNPDVEGKSEDDNYQPTDIIDSGWQRDCEDDTAQMIFSKTLPKMKKQPEWFSSEDHRSLRSGPSLAARALLEDWAYIDFLTLAKSGSSITAKGEKRTIVDQLKEIDSVVDGHRIDVLLISAGGNDVGFGDGLRSMAADFRNSNADKVLSDFIARIPKLRNEGYPALASQIRDMDVGTVLITEYPTGLFNKGDGQPARACGVFDNLLFFKVSKRNAVAITRMGESLNEEIKLAAKNHGWRMVTGIAAAFQKHGYCTGKQSFFRSATESCDLQGDFKGIMHPNEMGTAAYAEALERELRKVLPRPNGPPLNQ